MVTLKNGTNKCIRCCTRLNGRWFDGVLPGQSVECDEPHKVRALIKHGCSEVKTVKDVVKEYKPKKRKRKKEVV